MRAPLLILTIACLPGTHAWPPDAQVTAQPVRLLSCAHTFAADVTAGRLREQFGTAEVVTEEIAFPEGAHEPGTVLFPHSPRDRIMIVWKHRHDQRMPRGVFIHGDKSTWRTISGLTLGLHLRTLEKMNRRPFRLTGFAWDYDGTVMSWSGGALAASGSPDCGVRARLRPDAPEGSDDRRRSYWQVLGAREFSSGHPAMQTLNPTVYEVWLDFGR